MKIEVRGREICQSNNCIGLQADNNVEIRDFVLSRYYGDIDLSEGIAYLLFCDPSGRTGYIPLEKTVAEDSLNLASSLRCPDRSRRKSRSVDWMRLCGTVRSPISMWRKASLRKARSQSYFRHAQRCRGHPP